MKKATFFLSAFLILIFISQTSDAQITKTTRKKPLVMIEINGGYNLPMLDLRGDVAEFWQFENYGQSQGYNVNFTVKLGVKSYKMAQLRPYFTIGYSQFVSSKDTRAYIPSGYITEGWPKGYTYNDTTGTSEFLMRMPYAALGFEIAQYTDNKNRSSFNFGLDFMLSFIFGRANETLTYPAPGVAPANSELTHTMAANTRVGLGLNVVYNYRVAPPIGFNVGTRFQIMNLIGKDAKEGDGGEFFLLDGSDPSLNSMLSSGRTIGSLNLFGGVTFYIGRM